MKIYKKLTIPEDSAWNRNSIWGKLPWRLRSFLTGCKNIIKWSPILWKDRDWDHWFIFNTLQKKIEFQRSEIIYANRHTRVDIDNRDMTIVLNLIERVKDEYYRMEYLEFEKSEFKFIPVKDNPNLKELLIDVISEQYDEYLSKYPSTVRKVIREKGGDLETKSLCFYVAHENHKKAKNLLFKMLEDRLERWWD